jgi:hypothetical protein
MNFRPLAAATFLAALALASLAGCQSASRLVDPLALDPDLGYVPANFRGDAQLPSTLQRVAVLPVHGGAIASDESTSALDAVVVAALQQQQRFEVVSVPREDCHRLFGARDFSSVAALPHGFIEEVARRYAVDAVLFVDLTVYRPHQPIALGLRAKLAATSDVRMIWAFDEVFSAEDPRLRRTIRSRQRTAVAAPLVDPTPAVLQSPARFGTVAAELMFRTLPPR